jgi:hypothetical protein
MAWQVLGYFDNPETSRAREIAQFTYKDNLETREAAESIANKWKETARYPFVFIRNTETKEIRKH